MKKLLASLLACSLFMGAFTACGSKESANTESAGDSKESANIESTDGSNTQNTGTFLDDIEDNAEILYWEMQWGNSEYGQTTQKFVDKFNKENKYGIKVDLEMIPWDGYYQTFLTAVTSGSAPAACTGATPTPIQYAVMGKSLDLDPIMEAWKTENNPILTDIDQSMWDFFKYDGVQYGLPYGIDPKQILYRSDLFEEAGIKELPTTYDELIEAGRKLKEVFPDKVPVLMAGGGNDSSPNHVAYVLNACNAAGFTDENLKASMNSEAEIQNYEFIKTMYDEGIISKGSAGYGNADIEKMWSAGEACILFGPSGTFALDTGLENVTRVLPNISGPNASGKGKYNLCINGVNGFNETKYPNATRYFLKWWMENYKDLLINTGNGNLPARKSYYDDPFYKDNQFRADTYKYCISNGQPMTYAAPSLYPQFAQLEGEKTFSIALSKVLTGTDVKAACEEANTAIQKVLDDYAPE